MSRYPFQKESIVVKDIRRAKKRLGVIFKQYKYLEFLTWQLNTAYIKDLKPLSNVSCDDDLNLRLVAQMFPEP